MNNKPPSKNLKKYISKHIVFYDINLLLSLKHKLATAMRLNQTFRHIPVHPKDKHEPENKCEKVYEISCKGCDKVYVGETGRTFGTRLVQYIRQTVNIVLRSVSPVQKESNH